MQGFAAVLWTVQGDATVKDDEDAELCCGGGSGRARAEERRREEEEGECEKKVLGRPIYKAES